MENRTTQLILLCFSFRSHKSNDHYNVAHQQLISLLDYAKVDVNATTVFGDTALHLLCRYYKNVKLIDLVKLLILKGADFNARTNYYDKSSPLSTPLHCLCANYKRDNLIDLVKLFIENKADVNAEAENGRTPLHELCYNYKNDKLIMDIVKTMTENGADINTADSMGLTPLEMLRLRGFRTM